MPDREALETIFKEAGYTDYKWIKATDITVAEWVRFKCIFGCSSYGKVGSCPPFLPTVPECREFFHSYRDAVIFHFEKQVKHPDDRHVWSKKIDQKLVKLERVVFLAGYRKAFVLFIDDCTLCKECGGSRVQCKKPRESRPTPEGMAVDVFETAQRVGYPIEVLKGYQDTMNRYALLMVE